METPYDTPRAPLPGKNPAAFEINSESARRAYRIKFIRACLRGSRAENIPDYAIDMVYVILKGWYSK